MFRLLLLCVGWMLFSGFSAPHCSATDTTFGAPPEVLNPEEWEGYWCNRLRREDDLGCHCVYVKADEEKPGELWVEDFSNEEHHSFLVVNVRRAPRRDLFWFGFPRYGCEGAKCGCGPGKGANFWPMSGYMNWVLLQKSNTLALVWGGIDPDKLERAVFEGELPAERIGPSGRYFQPEYALIASLLTEEQLTQLVDGRFFVLETTQLPSPWAFVRSNELPDCVDHRD